MILRDSNPIASGLLDFTAYPMIFRQSRLQLVPSRDFVGFTSANFQGRRNWKWENFFRPFLRIGTSALRETTGNPDSIVMHGDGIELEAIYHGIDTLAFSIQCETDTASFFGPAGEHENFGGLLEQEFLIFFGYAKCQALEDNDLVATVDHSSAVLHVDGLTIERIGSGWRLWLPPGCSRLGLAAGDASELKSLRLKASQAAGEPIERVRKRNAVYWESLFSRLPKVPDVEKQSAGKAAIWTISSSSFAPEGQCRDEILGACKTAYAKCAWLWDTCFAIRGYARIDAAASRRWLAAFMEHQQSDGMLPASIGPFKRDTTTQVPIFAWAARAIFSVDGDRDFLASACASARRNHDWWMNQSDPSCGGLPATGPISYDNSPLYDGCRKHGMNAAHLVNPDIIAALVNDCDEIMAMASELGDVSLVSEMARRRIFLSETGHRHLFDPKDRFYYSCQGTEKIRIRTGPALTAIAFAPKAVACELAATYIRPGSPAWPGHGIASVFNDDPSYDPTNYWRGPIWGPTNRLIIDALERRGFQAEAEALKRETLALLTRKTDFPEVFHAETGAGRRATLMAGFGAGVLLDLLA